MIKRAIVWMTITVMFIGSARPASAQTTFVSGVYKIVSGSYTKCCGIAGPMVSQLPAADQSFVKLAIDTQTQLATMTFLGLDNTNVYSIAPCTPGYPIPFSFGYGFVSTDQMIFHVDPGPPPNSEYWSFGVSNSAGALRIDGMVGLASPYCADVPTQFTYSNVVAVLMPTAQIRVSEVEVCWNAASNATYQVQYQSELTTNNWLNLGGPILGTGLTNCITDKVLRGQPRRMYRVILVP